MPSIGLKDQGCLLNILDAIEKIGTYTSNLKDADEFNNSSLAFDATLMNFILIGEMAEKISEQFRHETNDLFGWSRIKGFRNIIAHNYFGVDAEEVWQIIHTHLPQLKSTIESLINR